MSEDEIAIMVARIEALAGERALLKREVAIISNRSDVLRAVQQERDRLRTDLKAAESKVYEWSEYAGILRASINAIDPKATKSKRIVLPDMPKPLDTDIPF